MKKTIYVIAVSFILLTALYSQEPNFEWAARYTGSPGYVQTINDAVTDENGNTYICGFIQIPDQINTKDAIVLKINSSGSIDWVNIYAGIDGREDEFDAIDIDITGNVYVTGFSFSDSSFTDVLTIKYDYAGNQVWLTKYNYSDDIDRGRDISVDENKNVYVTGYAYFPGPNANYITLKYDSSGNELWVRFFDGVSNRFDTGRELTLDYDNNVIVSGLTTRDISHNDVATIKYSSEGETLWTSIYAGVNNGGANGSGSLQTDNNGNIYFLSGIPNGPRRIVKYDSKGDSIWIKPMPSGVFPSDLIVRQNDFYLSASSLGDFHTYKYNFSGDTLWKRVYPVLVYQSNDVPQDAITDKHGNVYVTGYCDSSWLVYDYLTVKYDSSGNLKWSKRYSQALFVDDKAYKIGLDTSGNVYVTGISGGQITTVKYSQPPVGIINIGNEVPGRFELFQNYPNPFNPTTRIRYAVKDNSAFVELIVTDILGRTVTKLVDQKQNAGIYETTFEASQYASGVYFYSIEAGTYKDIKKMVLIK